MLSPFAVKLVRTQQVVRFFFTFFVSINYHDMTKYGVGTAIMIIQATIAIKKRVIYSKLDCSTSHWYLNEIFYIFFYNSVAVDKMQLTGLDLEYTELAGQASSIESRFTPLFSSSPDHVFFFPFWVCSNTNMQRAGYLRCMQPNVYCLLPG